MDPQNSGPYCILSRDLKVLSQSSFISLLQFSVATCSSLLRQYLFFSMFILSRQNFLYCYISLFGSLTLYPTRSVVISILWHDILMCVYWNNYVATCNATLFLCSFFKIVSWLNFYITTAFLLVLIATMSLILSAFLSRPGKSIAIESCLHLTCFLFAASFLWCDIVY